MDFLALNKQQDKKDAHIQGNQQSEQRISKENQTYQNNGQKSFISLENIQNFELNNNVSKIPCNLTKKQLLFCICFTILIIGGLITLIVVLTKKEENEMLNFPFSSTETYDLIVLSSESALCLDGSHVTYYISRTGDPKKVLIFFQGGAWCGAQNYQKTLQSCYRRSKHQKGSSRFFKSKIEMSSGILSVNSENYFKDWKKVYFTYCDGSGHQGSRKQPIIYNGTKLFFRGHNITTQRLQSLEQKIGLFSKAQNIVVSGSSAGGLASFYWSNYILQKAKTDKVYVFSDSGVFLDRANQKGQHFLRNTFKNVVNITNKQISNPINNCAEQYVGEEYKCMFIEYMYKYIKAPVFIAQSLYDTYCLTYIVGLTCDPLSSSIKMSECDQSELAILNNYRKEVKDLLTFMANTKKFGIWAIDCVLHQFINSNKFLQSKYSVPENSGNRLIKAFQIWIQNVQNTHVFMDDVQWPNNKPCH